MFELTNIHPWPVSSASQCILRFLPSHCNTTSQSVGLEHRGPRDARIRRHGNVGLPRDVACTLVLKPHRMLGLCKCANIAKGTLPCIHAFRSPVCGNNMGAPRA